MKKIILDTNFLMIPYQFKVDIFAEIERIADFSYNLYVVDKTIEELNKIIKEQKGKNKEAAKFALKMISTKKIKVIKTKSDKIADDEIVCLSKEDPSMIIATQDKDLKRRLINHRIDLIILRQKSTLVIVKQGL